MMHSRHEAEGPIIQLPFFYIINIILTVWREALRRVAHDVLSVLELLERISGLCRTMS